MMDDAVLAALIAGEAFVDLSSWRAIVVSGGDARSWLNDLVSADVGELRPGEARRSLVLTPTGRIRADVSVARRHDDTILFQDPAQPASIRDLLNPYVLSSDVQLTDRTGDVALFATPCTDEPPTIGVPDVEVFAPSVVGSGLDLMAPLEGHDAMLDALSGLRRRAEPEDLDALRVVLGIPRFGVDALPEDLPQEGGLAGAVAFDKGCYLGQEAVARVRNLGHPRRVVLHLSSQGRVSAGDQVVAAGREVGTITGAAKRGDAWLAVARVAWESRDEPLRSAAGIALTTLETP
jgi:folate-binding protein YgfZ